MSQIFLTTNYLTIKAVESSKDKKILSSCLREFISDSVKEREEQKFKECSATPVEPKKFISDSAFPRLLQLNSKIKELQASAEKKMTLLLNKKRERQNKLQELNLKELDKKRKLI